MDLLLEAKRHVYEYVQGLIPASDLLDWLGDAAPDASGNQPATGFIADVWRLLSEYGYGDRDEDSFRNELARIANSVETVLPRISATPWKLVTATLTNTVPAGIIPNYQALSSVKYDSESATHQPQQVPAA